MPGGLFLWVARRTAPRSYSLSCEFLSSKSLFPLLAVERTPYPLFSEIH